MNDGKINNISWIYKQDNYISLKTEESNISNISQIGISLKNDNLWYIMLAGNSEVMCMNNSNTINMDIKDLAKRIRVLILNKYYKKMYEFEIFNLVLNKEYKKIFKNIFTGYNNTFKIYYYYNNLKEVSNICLYNDIIKLDINDNNQNIIPINSIINISFKRENRYLVTIIYYSNNKEINNKLEFESNMEKQLFCHYLLEKGVTYSEINTIKKEDSFKYKINNNNNYLSQQIVSAYNSKINNFYNNINNSITRYDTKITEITKNINKLKYIMNRYYNNKNKKCIIY